MEKYEEQLAQEERVEALRKTQTKNNIAPEVKSEAAKGIFGWLISFNFFLNW